MNKKVYCILPAGQASNPAVLALIEEYKIKHDLPEIIIISPGDLKQAMFDSKMLRDEIQMHTDLILKSIDEGDSDLYCEYNPEERKMKKEQDKYRERNYRPNFKYGRR
jgi:hypothetical protein